MLIIIDSALYLYFIRGGVTMLVIGRRPGQYVVINDNIIVKVVRSDEGDLRLAIDAPRDIKIIRGELYEREKLQKAL
ncbi:carbon storage regulator, CsrA [Tepidimicrobium xylanilyticum]|uniref:Translational regulator CsrA n=2 Tax=Tepidimicrobium xylanilyticum TaxID=1123352 RepID=A0A1H2QT68_9FIRM|nr:carbon storage regulator, CsrA [Tepidimicrobium xylanilyticum]